MSFCCYFVLKKVYELFFNNSEFYLFHPSLLFSKFKFVLKKMDAEQCQVFSCESGLSPCFTCPIGHIACENCWRSFLTQKLYECLPGCPVDCCTEIISEELYLVCIIYLLSLSLLSFEHWGVPEVPLFRRL